MGNHSVKKFIFLLIIQAMQDGLDSTIKGLFNEFCNKYNYPYFCILKKRLH